MEGEGSGSSGSSEKAEELVPGDKVRTVHHKDRKNYPAVIREKQSSKEWLTGKILNNVRGIYIEKMR